ncbi:MAG: RnfABCDGE type electron transport complex subunit G [Desulfobacterales bacterium]|nr:RnfABCDGE type electron transport complex subunit G [Desulfobacterales bacterium]
MRDMIKMVLVLTILAAFSGGLLAAIKDGTAENIEKQKLTFVKGPAIKQILEGASNDPISDRFKLQDQDQERSFFVGVYDGKPKAVAFETFGKGFGGDIGVMVAVDVATDRIVGVSVTTHQETPGVGSRAKTDPDFAAQFTDKAFEGTFKVKPDGGQIDALSGATVTSRGVTGALTQATGVYERVKPQLKEKLQAFGN